jgi:hypothetical protein
MTAAAAPLPPRPDARPPAPLGELVAEFSGGLCPSLSALLERLIDRQAGDPRGVRP